MSIGDLIVGALGGGTPEQQINQYLRGPQLRDLNHLSPVGSGFCVFSKLDHAAPAHQLWGRPFW